VQQNFRIISIKGQVVEARIRCQEEIDSVKKTSDWMKKDFYAFAQPPWH
jgi:hypothetical protein